MSFAFDPEMIDTMDKPALRAALKLELEHNQKLMAELAKLEEQLDKLVTDERDALLNDLLS